MYTGSKARIFWSGIFSNMFAVNNGVKQIGVFSPLSFCVYFGVLIDRLTQQGYGCYIGLVFLADFVYVDDIVLLAPTATAMRSLLAICDIFATDFDVNFDAKKTKCIPFCSTVCQQNFYFPIFYVGRDIIEYVDSWPHLGHISSNNNSKHDKEDI